MNAKELFTDKENKYIYLERYVNDGSPSGFTEIHTTSDRTNPFIGEERFPLLEFQDSDIECISFGEHELFKRDVNYAHPDSINSEILKSAGRQLKESFLIVSPASSGRTMLLRNSQFKGYIKLTYDVNRLGRVDRQLALNNCLSGFEITEHFKKCIDEKIFPKTFAILLESASKISKLKTSDKIYEWGVVFREAKPYPYRDENVQLIPGFSLFSKDRKNTQDECLINQFIELSNSNPQVYLVNLIKMIVDIYWSIVLNCAFTHECQAQNCLFEVDENYNIKRMVIIDMDSVDKDIPLATHLKLKDTWDSPYGIYEINNPRYVTRSSTIYDHKLGEYLLTPLIKVVAEKYGLDILSIEKEIRNFVRLNYSKKLPTDYFPEDGYWYHKPKTERKPGEERIFIAKENPKYRGVNMSQEKFSKVINEMKTALDKKGNHLDMASIFVSEGDNDFNHYFKEREAVDIRSIAKPIACMAIGIAIDNGLYFDGKKIELNTPIWQFLTKYTKIENPENEKKWEKITLMDCFRITLGHDKGLVFSADLKEQGVDDLANYVVNYPITEEIGKHFVYSNAGTFLISTLITEYCQKNLDELVHELLFAPMNITDYSWKKYGKYCAGCTGLKMQNNDLHKIGKLLINDGVYNGVQLVPKNWIEQMRQPQVPAPTHRYIADRAYPKWSYGMNLWICENGNYYCDGTDGQYLIIIPKKDVVITALGFQSDTAPVSEILGIWKNPCYGIKE
jgi:hypothetical protein